MLPQSETQLRLYHLRTPAEKQSAAYRKSDCKQAGSTSLGFGLLLCGHQHPKAWFDVNRPRSDLLSLDENLRGVNITEPGQSSFAFLVDSHQVTEDFVYHPAIAHAAPVLLSLWDL